MKAKPTPEDFARLEQELARYKRIVKNGIQRKMCVKCGEIIFPIDGHYTITKTPTKDEAQTSGICGPQKLGHLCNGCAAEVLDQVGLKG